jgi:redox-sensitive bicupin YhaK (pirin superfamily)
MEKTNNYKIDVYPPNRQGSGEFDNGKITEIKPIDFPNGTGEGKRIGPLFYWAWASANGDGIIGMHPHQAFEIISYVLKGEIGHSDSLGNKTRVGAGGAQIMQTGSGVYHQEEMYGERTEFFQIWFEPNLREAIKTVPTYTQLTDKEFPLEKIDGTSVKKILGEGSPVKLAADAQMEELIIGSKKSFTKLLSKRILAFVVICGKGEIKIEEKTLPVEEKYYITINAENNIDVVFTNTGDNELRLALVEVPAKVNYPLYGEN